MDLRPVSALLKSPISALLKSRYGSRDIKTPNFRIRILKPLDMEGMGNRSLLQLESHNGNNVKMTAPGPPDGRKQVNSRPLGRVHCLLKTPRGTVAVWRGRTLMQQTDQLGDGYRLLRVLECQSGDLRVRLQFLHVRLQFLRGKKLIQRLRSCGSLPRCAIFSL